MNEWPAGPLRAPKRRGIKRCYIAWIPVVWADYTEFARANGEVVWLTDAQLTLARIKYPYKEFDLVLEQDKLEEYKKYME